MFTFYVVWESDKQKSYAKSDQTEMISRNVIW